MWPPEEMESMTILLVLIVEFLRLLDPIEVVVLKED